MLLRYPGGKTRAIKILIQYIPDKLTELYSPFFGGGSFELYLMVNNGVSIHGNDKFEPLYNFWNCVKTDKLTLINEINKLHPITKEIFHKCKQEITNQNIDKFIRGAYYFAINRSSFSGATMSGGFSKESGEKRFTKSSIDRINGLDCDNIKFYNLDFVQFINDIPKDKFMFLDPPYYIKSKLYGINGDLHEDFDHHKLYDLLGNRKPWILCYNDCEYIRNLYKNFKIITIGWKYGMNKTKQSSEILITNV